jgi:hypothetical protein
MKKLKKSIGKEKFIPCSENSQIYSYTRTDIKSRIKTNHRDKK